MKRGRATPRRDPEPPEDDLDRLLGITCAGIAIFIPVVLTIGLARWDSLLAHP